MGLTDELKAKAGTALFGVADSQAYGVKAPHGHRPADYLAEARSIVVVGVRLLDLPLDMIPSTRVEYTANFHVANAELNRVLFELASFLESRGHKAFPVPYKEMPGWNLENRSTASLRLMRHFLGVSRVKEKTAARLWENLSYRHMAVEAGLGELGVNNLLLTPEHGARVRLVALLTDAPLEPGAPLDSRLCRPDLCGNACVKACLAGALSADGGATDKAACLRYYLKLGIPGASGVRCGLCVARCPAYQIGFRESGE